MQAYLIERMLAMRKNEKNKSKVIGGIARSKALTKNDRSKIARKAAISRWGLKTTHRGNFKAEFGIDVECFVLDDKNKTAVISQSGFGNALGLGAIGSRLPRLVNSKTLIKYIGPDLRKKLDNPIIFQTVTSDQSPSKKRKSRRTGKGYDVTILIDLCKAIVDAENDGQILSATKQAHIILAASAKAGIKGLAYALAGYKPEVEEVIKAFKCYVQEEARKYESEFPNELYAAWQRIYKINPPPRGKNWKEMHLTIDHVYFPLAKSDGKLLELLRSAKISAGEKDKKLFQFLNMVGAKALRMQLGRVLEMAESSSNRADYEGKIVKRFGGQLSLDLPNYPIA